MDKKKIVRSIIGARIIAVVAVLLFFVTLFVPRDSNVSNVQSIGKTIISMGLSVFIAYYLIMVILVVMIAIIPEIIAYVDDLPKYWYLYNRAYRQVKLGSKCVNLGIIVTSVFMIINSISFFFLDEPILGMILWTVSTVLVLVSEVILLSILQDIKQWLDNLDEKERLEKDQEVEEAFKLEVMELKQDIFDTIEESENSNGEFYDFAIGLEEELVTFLKRSDETFSNEHINELVDATLFGIFCETTSKFYNLEVPHTKIVADSLAYKRFLNIARQKSNVV